MFLGEYRHTIDAKGRLAVPARFRSNLEEGLVVTRGLDPCLHIYSQAEWFPLAERLSGLPLGEPAVRALRRSFFASAYACEMDKQGRVLIPAPLREYAGLEGDVVVAGLHNYIELWSVPRWEGEELPRLASGASSLAEHLSSLGIVF
ncbi:MAG: division/cell wall cluster transcriptional repressor MraZ [Chloroflexia bacterium]|nr:division/cell wall cluster transcriptional repressor MraZ [Chloroflexia bacterium]